MFLFYICPRSLVLENANKLGEFHMVFLDEAADTVILKVNMKDDLIEQWFASQDGVDSLPHPIIDAAVPLTTEHMAKVASFIPVRPATDGLPAAQPPTVTIHDLIDAISKTDTGRTFRTRVF